jgi:twitching motility protein PilU
MNTARIADLMRKGEIDAIKEAMSAGQNEGMQTFDQALFALYRDGRLSLEEALSNADSATDLKLQIKLENAKNGTHENEAVTQILELDGATDAEAESDQELEDAELEPLMV